MSHFWDNKVLLFVGAADYLLGIEKKGENTMLASELNVGDPIFYFINKAPTLHIPVIQKEVAMVVSKKKIKSADKPIWALEILILSTGEKKKEMFSEDTHIGWIEPLLYSQQ